MGIYLNPESFRFRKNVNAEIYVDKSELLVFTNRKINTPQGYLCVSRPRRFGKSMAADMLAAYYGCGADTGELFAGLKITGAESYEKHRNQYHVIKVDMQNFMTTSTSVRGLIDLFCETIREEIREAFPEVKFSEKTLFWDILMKVFQQTRRGFVLLIDEWDCVMRRYGSEEDQRLYLDFLRALMKDQPYIALAYMTGILPIKKYGEHSTLNMFYEYSMMNSDMISDCFGFTEEEVQELCERYRMDFNRAKEWYDGYHLVAQPCRDRKDYSMYSPKSIVESMLQGRYDVFWSQTETYDALRQYIRMDMNGLREAVIALLGGISLPVQTRSFQNDMMTFHSKDDVLTLLIHLGYLAYDQDYGTVSIPNKEVRMEFVAAMNDIEAYSPVMESVQASRELLQSLWEQDEGAVAAGVEKAHQELSILKYNDENALSCAITLAFYYAREYYTVFRELPTGKGFADIVLIPRPRCAGKPAVLIELKWKKDAVTAMAQIREKNYPEALQAYAGNLLLCGISYDKAEGEEHKKHYCVIEKI